MVLTVQDFAQKINGVEYFCENDFADEAKQNGLIFFYGANDDLLEVNGYVREETGAGDKTTVLCGKKGFLPQKIELSCPTATAIAYLEGLKKQVDEAITVTAKWCPDGSDYSWEITVDSDHKHAHFDVVEDGELFCKGVVVAVPDAWL